MNSEIEVAGWVLRGQGSCLTDRMPALYDEKFREKVVVMVAQPRECVTATEFKNGEEGGFYVVCVLPQLKVNKQKCTQSQACLRGPALTGHKDGQIGITPNSIWHGACPSTGFSTY